MTKRYYDYLETDIGALLLFASDAGLEAIYHDNGIAEFSLQDAEHDQKAMAPYVAAIKSYLSGESEQFNCALNLQTGTELQQSVWGALQQVPYGSTISYTTLAQRVGKADAVRAVASACGKNPLPLIIPCHRIIAKDGTLGGFAWGLDVKQTLLQLENANHSQILAA